MNIKKFIAALLSLALLSGLSACAGNSSDSNTVSSGSVSESSADASSDLKLPEEDWPVVDGATAFLPFYTTACAQILDKTEEEASRYVLCSTTDYAYPDLADKKADLIFCFGPSDDQVEYAAGRGVSFEYVPLLNEAFVFFVNKNNPVDSVTVQQLHDIYAGKITNWKELGGNDEEIIAYQRSEGSGSQTGLYKFVISKDEVAEPLIDRRIFTMEGIVDVVANYDNARGGIGYSYLYFVKNQHYDENIKLLKVEGVSPDTHAISSGTYPMINTAYAVFRSSELQGSTVRQIAEWCAGQKAGKLAEGLGYVPYGAPEEK